MVSCELCRKEFKTRQALCGHLRFEHPQQVATGATAPATPAVAEEKTQPITEILERQEEILSAVDDGVRRLLELQVKTLSAIDSGVDQILAKMDALSRDYEPMRHGLCQDKGCLTCRSVINQTGQFAKGQVLSTPGVREAISFHEKMQGLGMNEGWSDVKEIWEAAETHRLLRSPATLEDVDTIGKEFGRAFPPGWVSSIMESLGR